MGKVAEAEERLREAIALGREMGLAPRELVRLHYWIGEVLFWQSRYDDMIRIGVDGLVLLGDDAASSEAVESVEAVLTNQHIAAGHLYKGNIERFRELTDRTAQFIQRLPYVEELRPAYNHLISLCRLDKDAEGAMKWIRVLEEKATPSHDLRALAEAHWLAGWVLSCMGELRGAMSRYRQALELCGRIGDAKHQSWYLRDMGWACLRLGDLYKAEEYADRMLEIAEAVGNKNDIAWCYRFAGRIALCRGDWKRAGDASRKAAQLYQEISSHIDEAWAIYYLGRAHLAQGNRVEAVKWCRRAVALAGLGILKNDGLECSCCISILGGLEAAYDDFAAFRAFSRRFQEEHPEFGDSPFIQWFLEPAEPREGYGLPISDFGFDTYSFRNLKSKIQNREWVWEDPFGGCSFTVQNGLKVHVANGRDLWHINWSAPRVLRSASGNLAIQTVCVRVSDERPAIGGLVLWKDRDNYLRLDRGDMGERQIFFGGCLENQDVIIGRGCLPLDASGRGFLRLERVGERVDALCSADGENWFTVGHAVFPVQDPVQVGLHAIGNIDRSVYHGAYPDGTAIRFESFWLWHLNH
jgi:tetratricopeptide (TPR) repeat protein